MSFDTAFVDGCPAPFYNAAQWGDEGAIAARVCMPTADTGNLTCCLPCPVTQWIYPESAIVDVGHAAAILNIASIVGLLFVLLSYAFLPVHHTRSHYLNTGLVISIVLINLAFIVPYANNTESCANPITPNDMESSTPCAFSGAFLLSGALSAVMWVLIRAVSMHLQICWSTNPGRRFYLLTQIGGWVVPGAVFIATMAATGVSFRFGPNICHINHENSMADFWSWLLLLAGIAVIVQMATMTFCIKVYMCNLWSDEQPSTYASTGSAPSIYSRRRPKTAAAVYRRLKRVLWLQWRGLATVTVMLIDVIFFTVVFFYLDRSTVMSAANIARATPWVECLIEHSSEPAQCFALGQDFLVSAGTIDCVLILLSIIGIMLLVLVFRPSFFTGWRNFFSEMFYRDPPSQPAVRHDSNASTMDEKLPPSVYELDNSEKLSYDGSASHIEEASPRAPSRSESFRPLSRSDSYRPSSRADSYRAPSRSDSYRSPSALDSVVESYGIQPPARVLNFSRPAQRISPAYALSYQRAELPLRRLSNSHYAEYALQSPWEEEDDASIGEMYQ